MTLAAHIHAAVCAVRLVGVLVGAHAGDATTLDELRDATYLSGAVRKSG